jgi:hypothetical protein
MRLACVGYLPSSREWLMPSDPRAAMSRFLPSRALLSRQRLRGTTPAIGQALTRRLRAWMIGARIRLPINDAAAAATPAARQSKRD